MMLTLTKIVHNHSHSKRCHYHCYWYYYFLVVAVVVAAAARHGLVRGSLRSASPRRLHQESELDTLGTPLCSAHLQLQLLLLWMKHAQWYLLWTEKEGVVVADVADRLNQVLPLLKADLMTRQGLRCHHLDEKLGYDPSNLIQNSDFAHRMGILLLLKEQCLQTENLLWCPYCSCYCYCY